ncbi:hypothetical protein V2A60_004641 [Cordyceps javanica]|uniref:Peptidase family m1 domain-containing protein n=1 Tax=Cordyceps javanica TaxID=43265 RepID=A0A545VBP2_9HYPO|nr:peptidase family m1 domain-containing protein [Cordyceps javanica]TQW11174.1 peptidase family m1 domain-containing protein [Cordyceps javanica]
MLSTGAMLPLEARALELFEREFGVDFPLPKMDQIAVLGSAEGAMENWGRITYRAVDLLIEANAGAGRRRRVTDIVLHELAHQWFGNSVTMEWLARGRPRYVGFARLSLEIFLVPPDSFFKLTVDHSSVYRTLYSPEIFTRLAQAGQARALSIADATGLIADAAAVIEAGYIKTSTFLTLAQNFKGETSFFAWQQLLAGLDEAVTEGLEIFGEELITPIDRKIDYQSSEADDHVDQQLKDLITMSAAMCGDEETIEAAQNIHIQEEPERRCFYTPPNIENDRGRNYVSIWK